MAQQEMTPKDIAAPRSDFEVEKVLSKYKRPKMPITNFEMLGWLFMRISGVFLVVLIAGHLIVNLVLGGGVHQIDFAFVAGKWTNPFWQVWDLAMLWLAMLHGGNGLRTIINDYAEKPVTRKIFKLALYIAVAFTLIVGTLVIFTFDPCMVDNSGHLYEGVPSFCHDMTR